MVSTDRINGLTAAVAIKAPVRAATTANITLSGAQTIDGVAVVADDRVLVKNQTDTTENGIYDASATAWSRAKDFNGARDVVQGTTVLIYEGTANAGKWARCTTANTVTIGTDAITWDTFLIIDTTIAADLATLAPISADVTTVAGITADLSTVAGISSDVTTVAGDTVAINSALTNIAAIIAAPGAAAAAATSETNAGTSETNAAASATTALAAAQGWGAVTTLTTGTTNVEVANARTYYILDATGGTITVNMPAIGTSDGILFGFEVSNVDNAITIVRDGTDTINGVAGNYSGLISVGQVIHFIGDDTSPDNWLATIISQVSAASDTVAGIIELSTDAEALTGTATNRATTPANIASLGYSTKTRTTRANTGTTDTLVLADAGNIVTSSNASAQTVTIPPNSSVAFAVGTQIDIINKGAGVTSVAGGAGVTVNGVSTGTGAIDAQYKAVTIIKDETDVWFMVGAHGTVA